MKLFLLSESIKSIWKNGRKIRSELDEKNGFAANLRSAVEKHDNFVFVCNNPLDCKQNDISAKFVFKALKKGGLKFKKLTVLDNRNKEIAKDIIENADLMLLQGGKLECQLEFFEEIGLNKLLKNSKAVIMGKSAGAMNLGLAVYAYPEDASEIGNEKWLRGLGFHNFIIIPHFNFMTGNEYCEESLNILIDYYLPDSEGKKFYAIPNGSYILVDENETKVYGEAYIIENGKVQKICEDGKALEIGENEEIAKI